MTSSTPVTRCSPMANDLTEGVHMDDERIEALLEAGCPPELVELVADLPSDVAWYAEPAGGNAQFMHVKAGPGSPGAIYVDHRHMSVALDPDDASETAQLLQTRASRGNATTARLTITPAAVATSESRKIATEALQRSLERSSRRVARSESSDESNPDVPAAPPGNVQIGVPCVLLRVSRLWSAGMHVDDIYDITRGWWKIGPKREQALYALAVADGFVRAVFEIHEWQPQLLDDDGTPVTGNPRWGFDGEPASEQQHLVGLDVRHLFPQGAANPVRYLNIDGEGNGAEPSADVDTTAPDDTVEDPTWTAASLAIPDLSVRHHYVMTHCEQLRGEPLLAASLHSRELFHSNLIGWVLEQSPEIVLDALSPWLETNVDQADWAVLREHRHLDLVVAVPGKSVVVIENKVFSLPDESQLDRYAEVNIQRVGIKRPTKLLLSLIDPGWAGGEYHGWTWVPLPDLIARVVNTAINRFDDFTQELLGRWQRMVAALEGIARVTAPDNPHAPYLLETPIVDRLRTVRMHDAFGKARNFQTMRLVRDHLARMDVNVDRLSSGFSNGSPILSGYLSMPDGSEIGWQYQNSQWRRCVITPEHMHGRSPGDIARRVAYVEDTLESWMDFSAEQAAGPFRAAPSTDFKHFNPNFVYDYVRVPNVTVGKVLELAEITSRAAHELRTRALVSRATGPGA